MKGDGSRRARFMFDLDRRHLSEDPAAAEPDNGLSAEDHALLADYIRRMEAGRYSAANDDELKHLPDSGESRPYDHGKGKPEVPNDE